MRALRYMLILVVALVAGGHASFAAPMPLRPDVGPGSGSGSIGPSRTILADTPALPGRKGEDLIYLPKQGAPEDDESASVGMLLIIAAVVVFAVIIGFVIRHHRSGRAG